MFLFHFVFFFLWAKSTFTHFSVHHLFNPVKRHLNASKDCRWNDTRLQPAPLDTTPIWVALVFPPDCISNNLYIHLKHFITLIFLQSGPPESPWNENSMFTDFQNATWQNRVTLRFCRINVLAQRVVNYAPFQGYGIMVIHLSTQE